MSMPAVTTRLDRTKHDIRNGRKTGSPVSVTVRYRSAATRDLTYQDVLWSQLLSSPSIAHRSSLQAFPACTPLSNPLHDSAHLC